MGVFPTNYTDKASVMDGDKVFGYDSESASPSVDGNKNFTLLAIYNYITSKVTTTEVDEGTNLYFTDARVAANSTVVAKANSVDVLEKTNTTVFVPTTDYHPSTKKYVDDETQGLATTTNVLTKDNTIVFSPTGDYNPATKKYVDDAPNSNSTVVSITAGENIGEGLPVRKGVGSYVGDTLIHSAASSTGGYRIGYDGTEEAAGQSITVTNGGNLTSIDIMLRNIGSSASREGNIICEIYENITDAEPLSVATNSIAINNITSSDVLYTYSFNSFLTPGTYYIKVSADVANIAASPIISLRTSFNISYSGGVPYEINSSNTWTEESYDWLFNFNINSITEDVNKVYKAEWEDFIGFNNGVISSGNDALIDISGVNENQSGLTQNSKYYLGSVAGTIDTIGNTLIGKAISPTQILINAGGF